MTHTQLVQAIKQLVPAALEVSGYTVAVDSQGDATIATWNDTLGAEPTADELDMALTAMQLAQAKQSQIATLQSSANAAQSSFTSSALGSVYTYPSQPTDQANLTACATYSLFPGNPSDWTCLFYCTSSTGAAGFMPHTAAQIQQVGRDGMASIMAAKSKMATLAAEVMATTSIAEVEAVVWG